MVRGSKQVTGIVTARRQDGGEQGFGIGTNGARLGTYLAR